MKSLSSLLIQPALGLCLLLHLQPVDAWIDFSIRYWAGVYGLNEDCFMELARRESSLDPYAIGPAGEVGLFQWKLTPWDWAQTILGDCQPYARAVNPWVASQTAAFMLSTGKYDHWWRALPYCGCSIRDE